MQVARMQKMIHQTELGTSCIWSKGWGHGSSNSPVSSLLPSKRPGRFQEVRKRLRKMTLISSFLPMKSISFPGSRWSRARPKLLALLDWIISVLHSTAQSLCSHLTGIIDSGWILHEFSFSHGLNQMVLCCFNMAAHDHRCSGSTFKEKQIIIRNENYYWGMLLFKIFIVTLL